MRVFKACDVEIPLNKTIVMGILNATPDSFSDGGKHNGVQDAVKHALLMKAQGADIIDIGGQSTRPGHIRISAEEELERVRPVLQELKEHNLILSIDTFYPQVAREAIKLGVKIINDVSGFYDAEMIEVARESGAGCILVHSEDITSHNDPTEAVSDYFREKTDEMICAGILPQSICLDVGIGFGKTYEQNLVLLKGFDKFSKLGFATMSAASRKRVIGESCGNPPYEDRDGATIAAHTISIFSGADMIRVHEVKNAVLAAKVADAIISEGKENG